MSTIFTIQIATSGDVPEEAAMLGKRLDGIMLVVGVHAFNFDVVATISRLGDFLDRGKYFVFVDSRGVKLIRPESKKRCPDSESFRNELRNDWVGCTSGQITTPLFHPERYEGGGTIAHITTNNVSRVQCLTYVICQRPSRCL